MNDTEMKDADMVFNKEEGKIMAGGYLVNSLLLNEGKPATYSSEEALLHGGKGRFSDRFKNLAVPAGLLYMQSKPMHVQSNDDNVVNDELYEKLLKLAYENKEADNKQKTTKKRKAKQPIKNKTKSKRK